MEIKYKYNKTIKKYIFIFAFELHYGPRFLQL